MKNIINIILIIGGIFVSGITLAQNDTLNQTDANGLKQGYWKIYFSDNPSQVKMEGRYVDNKKQGIWKTYFPSGKIKSEVTYVNNRPNGYAKINFYAIIEKENGVKSELSNPLTIIYDNIAPTFASEYGVLVDDPLTYFDESDTKITNKKKPSLKFLYDDVWFITSSSNFSASLSFWANKVAENNIAIDIINVLITKLLNEYKIVKTVLLTGES